MTIEFDCSSRLKFRSSLFIGRPAVDNTLSHCFSLVTSHSCSRQHNIINNFKQLPPPLGLIIPVLIHCGLTEIPNYGWITKSWATRMPWNLYPLLYFRGGEAFSHLNYDATAVIRLEVNECIMSRAECKTSLERTSLLPKSLPWILPPSLMASFCKQKLSIEVRPLDLLSRC